MGIAELQNLAARCRRCTFVNGGGNSTDVAEVLSPSVDDASTTVAVAVLMAKGDLLAVLVVA